MTEEELIATGFWCEELLQSDFFELVCAQFTQQLFEQWVSSEEKNPEERDHLYAKARALGDFLGHLKAFVNTKNDLIKTEEPSDEDALMEIDYQ